MDFESDNKAFNKIISSTCEYWDEKKTQLTFSPAKISLRMSCLCLVLCKETRTVVLIKNKTKICLLMCNV